MDNQPSDMSRAKLGHKVQASLAGMSDPSDSQDIRRTPFGLQDSQGTDNHELETVA